MITKVCDRCERQTELKLASFTYGGKFSSGELCERCASAVMNDVLPVFKIIEKRRAA